MRLRCVVEGHGDVVALPILLRRIAQERCGVHVDVGQPFRAARHTVIKPGELERAVRLSARQAGPDGAVIVVLDADDDCPAQLGPQLLERALGSSEGRPVILVLAEREFEGWLLAGARSLRGKRGLPIDLEPPEAAESIRNAKGWLAERMGGYRETLDQPALTAQLSLEDALGAGSFAKLVRDLEALLRPR